MNYLDPNIALSPLASTIRELRNQNYNVISAALIAVTHSGKGYSINENTVARRLSGGTQRELEDAYPKVSMHPVSGYYLQEMPSFKDAHMCRVPPRSKWEDEIIAEVILCLAIGKKTMGLRFPEKQKLGQTDLLFRVWRLNNHNTAIGKLFYSAHKTAIGCINGLIPKAEALNIMVGALVAIRNGINDPPRLPAALKEIEAAIHGAYKGEWEKNFNKSQNGKWRL